MAAPAGDTPAKAGSSEVTRGGTLRVNLSNTDFEYRRPGARLRRGGLVGALHDEPDAPQLSGQARPRGLAPDSGRCLGLPGRLEGRQDLHVHIQQRPQLQRRLGGDGGGVQACLRTRGRPRQASPATAFIHSSSAPTPASRQGLVRRRHDRRGPEADDQADRRTTRRSSPRSRCRSSRPSSRTWRSTPRGSTSIPRPGPYRISARETGRRRTIERNTLLQAATARRTPTGSCSRRTPT